MLKPGNWARLRTVYDPYTGDSCGGAWHLVARENRIGFEFACGRRMGVEGTDAYETTAELPARECGSCIVAGQYDHVMRRKEAGDYD